MRGTQRRSIFRRRKAGLTDYRRRLKLTEDASPALWSVCPTLEPHANLLTGLLPVTS